MRRVQEVYPIYIVHIGKTQRCSKSMSLKEDNNHVVVVIHAKKSEHLKLD